eukprot:TRINITY_DN407_c0_g1_i1.p1 TRINITY_DN407_c0_g1~~TRINITY_DN407_c0_g1_i1.p1  ORF type:complete len:177 (+),score=11.28 TRINITY_DN407_c0_g1_i1:78-608(+)
MKALLFLVAAACVVIISARPLTTFSCQFELNNKAYDLSPLIAQNGSYQWHQQFNGTDTIFQLQICGDVHQDLHYCLGGPAPANMIDTSTYTCTALGDSNVYSWDLNPYNDGVRLTYYHGDRLSNIAFYSATVYFVCDPSVLLTEFVAEHERTCVDPDGGQTLGGYFHFTAKTKLVC